MWFLVVSAVVQPYFGLCKILAYLLDGGWLYFLRSPPLLPWDTISVSFYFPMTFLSFSHFNTLTLEASRDGVFHFYDWHFLLAGRASGFHCVFPSLLGPMNGRRWLVARTSRIQGSFWCYLAIIWRLDSCFVLGGGCLQIRALGRGFGNGSKTH